MAKGRNTVYIHPNDIAKSISTMYVDISKHNLPRPLNAGLLVDAYHRPRYWAVVWSSVFAGQLATSTRTDKLRKIEALYMYSDELHGIGALDSALGGLN